MNTLDLDTLTLAAGDHYLDDGEMCVMEAVAFIAGEKWTDHPKCASPVIGAFMRAWNDALNDDDRQDLKRYILRLVDSRGTPEQEDLRGWLALDWLVRVHTPAWLRLAGMTDQADRLAESAEIRPDTVQGVKPALDAALEDAYAAWDAAWGTEMGTTWDTVGAAAWDAAAAAARTAAWDAAWVATTDTAGASARVASMVAAHAAARGALDPTRRELQQSAHDLVDRMLAVTEGDPA